MTIIQLETFLSIEKNGSFSGAATELGYAQSTVTMQMKQLEDELGCLLFDRLGKKVVLTAEGDRLLGYAKKMIEIEREIKLAVPEGDEPVGTLRLGVSESLCYNRLPQILMNYKRSFPGVSIQTHFIMHDTFPGMLKNGELDIVYTINPLIESDELRLIHKRKETLGLYVCPDHKLASKKSVREKDLEDIPLLLTSHRCSFRAMLIAALQSCDITPVIALETTNKTILKTFAKNGLGAAFIPDMVASEDVKEGSLVRLAWKGAAFPIYSQLFVHKDKHISPAMQALIELL
ncbi:MAG: LysR family transcriptional regulator [Lachnospiraceae bacterium]|nr:LysR family transcriptional regulator [Lachnospiraceae bacterium]